MTENTLREKISKICGEMILCNTEPTATADRILALIEKSGPVMPETPSERVLACISDDVDAMLDGIGGSIEDIYYGIRDITYQELGIIRSALIAEAKERT